MKSAPLTVPDAVLAAAAPVSFFRPQLNLTFLIAAAVHHVPAASSHLTRSHKWRDASGHQTTQHPGGRG
jgi:hypothetical protein